MSLRSSKHEHTSSSTEELLMGRLPARWPITCLYYGESLEHALSTLSTQKESPRNCDDVVRIRQALIQNEDLRRAFDFRLTKSMAIENLLMEEKIKRLSRFVLPESFDMGLSHYFSRVSHQVKSCLRAKGLYQQENPKLREVKEKWLKRKLELNREKYERENKKSVKKQHSHADQTTLREGSIESLPLLKKYSPGHSYARLNITHKQKLKKKAAHQEQEQLFIMTGI